MSHFPRYVDIEFSARCNLRCGFCFGPSDNGEVKDLSIPFWENVIRNLSERGCEGVVISGGEPTLYPGLMYLLSVAKSLKLQTVLSTHGRHEEKVMAVASYCDWIALPVDGFSPDALRLLRGDTWGLDDAVALAGRLKSVRHGQLRLKLGTVATRVNVDEIVKLAEQLRDLRNTPFDTWKIYQYTPRRKFASDRHLYEMNESGFGNLVSRVAATGICSTLHTVFSSHDLRRQAYLFVYPDGTVATPNEGSNFSDIVLGNLVTDGNSVLDRAYAHELICNRSNYEATYA